MHFKINLLTFCKPGYIEDYLINPFMARAPDVMTIHLTLCNPELIKGYFNNPIIAGAPDDQSINHLTTKKISKLVKLTHSWPMNLMIIHFTFCIHVKGFSN